MRDPNMTKERLLGDVLLAFPTNVYSVNCLIRSQREERHPSNAGHDLDDRNWNWRDDNYRFSPSRSREQPGYIGSYCMDALAMALHCVYSTNSFPEAVLKIVNMRGDSDSTGAVCGQIAGALYGVKTVPRLWIQAIQQWDQGGMIALKAFRLMTKR